MLSLKQITLSRTNKILLKQSSFEIYAKQKMGIIGPNGCGKSTLFQLILGKIEPDEGEMQLSSALRMSHLSQEIPDSCEAALDFVLAGDEEYQQLKNRLDKAEQEGLDAEVLFCHERLAQNGGYSKPATAASLMNGLGFKAEDQQSPVNAFSGGWRMRLNLARCLMKPADLLLLDEPTNHLDMEAIIWLERFLKQSSAAILLISHDREFLDGFATDILHFHQQKLKVYSGNYSQFEKLRAAEFALQQQQYNKQQQKIHHMMDFVNRFKAKATKARQAQSRLKAIEKIQLVAMAQADSPFSFEFFEGPVTSNPLLRTENLCCGYKDKVILANVNLILNKGDRIALLGPNGEGKSTLIKSLTASLPPLSGKVEQAAKLQIGYYAQHQLEVLDLHSSPLQTIQTITPKASEQSIRDFLGGFDFRGDAALSSIAHFSGGEKARLALAKLVWQKPNLLLLDEPTNHLDLDMRSAIEIALQSYEGALILISHDRHLLKTVVDDFYLVYQQKVSLFKGEIHDYYAWLDARTANAESHSSQSKLQGFRDRKILQNRLKKLEQTMESTQKQLNALAIQLHDPAFYEVDSQNDYGLVLKEQKKLQTELLQLETEWLGIMDSLEK